MRGLLDVVPDSPAGPARGSAPRGGGGGGGRGGSGDASFDTNMVIILAALLCALIFALGLNSIARFALRCGRRLAAADASSSSSSSSSSAAAAAAEEGGTTGLKQRALRRIPVEVYGRGGGGGAGAAEGDGEGAECAICLGEFTDGEKVRVLPTCRHGFHVRCIDTWLAEHSSCPTCRSSLLRIDPRAGVGTAPPQQSGSPSPSPSPVASVEGR